MTSLRNMLRNRLGLLISQEDGIALVLVVLLIMNVIPRGF